MRFHLSTSVGWGSGDAPGATTTATSAIPVAATTASHVRRKRLIFPSFGGRRTVSPVAMAANGALYCFA
jgi:hypothetical protein